MQVQAIHLPGANAFPVWVYRLDQNDAQISGNKFYKLQPWINKAKASHKGLISCGGAFSNHLHALAAAGHKNGFATVGLVRALDPSQLTVTMQDCQSWGMQLLPVSREAYRDRYQPGFAQRFMTDAADSMIWVPEGGTDEQAVSACEQMGLDLNPVIEHYAIDSVWLAVGSGGTLAGIARQLDESVQLYAVPVMSHFDDVKQRVQTYLSKQQFSRIHWLHGGAYGGFGRANQSHQIFMQETDREIEPVRFDPVYTSKVLRRIQDAVLEQLILTGHRPLLIHTGGLQGRRSYRWLKSAS